MLGYLRGDGPQLPSAATKAAAGQASEGVVRKKVEFDAAQLAEIAAPWRSTANLLFLANRSSADPAALSSADFLRLFYGAEKVLVFTDYYSQGEYLWPADAEALGKLRSSKLGAWFLPQPVSGEVLPNPEGKPRPDGSVPLSRRTQHCVTAFRYLVLESDKADVRDWLGFIVQVPLRIEALYTSGGRSIHALVRVDCRTKKEWDAAKQELMPFLMTWPDKDTAKRRIQAHHDAIMRDWLAHENGRDDQRRSP
jgi:hypothetical protein